MYYIFIYVYCIYAVEWIPTVPTRGIGAIAARIVQELDQQGEGELDATIEQFEEESQLQREGHGSGIVSYAFRDGDQGVRRLQIQRGQVQWQQRIKRQWQDVFGNELTTIKIIEPQPQSEADEDLHVMIYMEDLNPACILVDIKDGSGLLHRRLQHQQNPVTGFEVLANHQVDPRRWDGALFRRNGRIWRGWDRVRHQHGWYWSILLEDDERQDEDEETAFMQRVIREEAASSSCDGQVALHLFHRRADYRPAVLRSGDNLEEVVNEAWRLPGHGPQAIRQLHDVLYPPNFVKERDSVIIVELNADEESKFQPDEVLCLLQIVFASGSADTSGDIDVFRTLWTPATASRLDILYHFRVAEQCQRRYGIRCEIKVNHVVWREQDSIIRHFENGDFIKIVVYPAPGDDAAVTRQAFCRQEMHQRNRRVLQSSTSDSAAGTEESQEEDESEQTERSRSRGRNQSEEEESDDAPILLQLSQGEPLRRENWKISQSHVLDRWCTSDRKVSTDLKLPQSRTTISLEELIETDWAPSESIKRSLDLDVDGAALQDFQEECEQTQIVKLLPEEAFEELTPVAKAWHKTCETDQHEPTTVYIYVDGSAMGGPNLEEQYKAAAFAVVLYGEDEDTKGRSFQGWAGGQVEVNPESEAYNGATKVDAINAERSAILLALKIANGRRRKCNYEICFDNQAAGYGADGTWRTDQASDIACRIRLLTLLIQQQGGKIRFQHVKAHSNQPQNDVADTLAKLINLGKIRGTSANGNARITTSATLHQLLLVAGAGRTFPIIKDKTMWWKHEAKAAPTTIDIPLTSPFDRRWVDTTEDKEHSLHLRLMSYNVLTLRPWKVNGHDPDAAMPQKAALLAQQLIARQVNIAGLQETRNSQSGVFKHDGVYRMVAQGTKQGTHGCEIWVNLTVPIASMAGRPFFVDPDKITVKVSRQRFSPRLNYQDSR